MTDRDALYRAVCRDPHDDTPRLVYADWLDEQPTARVKCRGRCGGYLHPGKYPDDLNLRNPIWLDCPDCDATGTVEDTHDRDLAEFIRLGVEWGSWCRPGGMFELPPDAPGKKRAGEVGRRLEALESRHRDRWATCACPHPDCVRGTVTSERGEGFTCPTCGGTGDLLRRMLGSRDQSFIVESRNPTFARGFVGAVECTLAEVGREEEQNCWRCFGSGMAFASRSQCTLCRSTGTVRTFVPSPWAAAVVTHTPVTRLVVPDGEPYTGLVEGGRQRFWWPNRLPDNDSRRGRCCPPPWLRVEGEFDSAAAARDALALALGRVVREAAAAKERVS